MSSAIYLTQNTLTSPFTDSAVNIIIMKLYNEDERVKKRG